MAADYTPTLGENSVYTVTAGSESDYSFKTTTDGENISYWKININKDNLSTASTTTWEQAGSSTPDSVEIRIPNAANSNIFSYTYTAPVGYEDITTAVDTLYVVSEEELQNKVFRGVEGIASGALAVEGNVVYDVIADFVGNSSVSTSASLGASGGAIHTWSTLGDVTGSFIGNYSESEYNYGTSGGAIYNQTGNTIGDITGDFIGNRAISNVGNLGTTGGAIYNMSWNGKETIIGNITGNFVGNFARNTNSEYTGQGGAIYNDAMTDSVARIGNITGSFVGNSGLDGGAIYNIGGEIGDITGDFFNNEVSGYGGAIYQNGWDNGSGGYQKGKIGNIRGDFVGNNNQGTYSKIGGAIYNNCGSIESITGNFIANGNLAIYNSQHSDIGDIKGDFIENYSLMYSSYGGAIENAGSISSITGNFIGNNAQTVGNGEAMGGAIYNGYSYSNNVNSSIGDITGNFTRNYAQGKYTYGGAIKNDYTIGNIKGDFVGNYTSSGDESFGGAIYNRGVITSIRGNFTDNYSESSADSYNVYGGAIYNSDKGSIGNITGDFTGNHVSGANANGGAIGNSGDIGYIKGNFVGNYASSNSTYSVSGGAVAQNVSYGIRMISIGNITGDFRENHIDGARVSGGAIGNHYNESFGFMTVGDITGNIISNYAEGTEYAHGGAIYNGGSGMMNGVVSDIGDITGDIIGNYAKSSEGNAKGGFLYNSSIVGDISGNIKNNYVEGKTDASGGAIYLDALFDEKHFSIENHNIEGYKRKTGTTVKDSVVEGNYAKSETGNATGGAFFISGQQGSSSGPNITDWSFYEPIYNATADEAVSVLQNVYSYSSFDDLKTANDLTNYILNVDFKNNYADAYGDAKGGALFYRYDVADADISGDFTGNYAKSATGIAHGGAVYNEWSTINFTNSSFKENYTRVNSYVSISPIEEMLERQGCSSTDEMAQNMGFADTDDMLAHLDVYSSVEEMAQSFGYADVDDMLEDEGFSTVEEMAQYYGFSGVEDMIDGYDSVEEMAALWGYSGYASSSGGAIFNDGGIINITSKDGYETLLSGNYVSDDNGYKDYQAIYMSGGGLNLKVQTKGKIIFDDKIDGGDYVLNIFGDDDEDSYVKFNNVVSGVHTLGLGKGAFLHLGLNSDIQARGMMVVNPDGTLAQSASMPTIKVDVKARDDKSGFDAGTIHVGGDVQGQYSVIVNALTPDVLEDLEAAKTPFLFAPNDNESTPSGFEVARVIGSPYMWEGAVNAKGETEGSTWYLNLTEEENPDYEEEEDPVDPEDPDDPVEPDDPVNPDQPDIRHLTLAPEVLSGIGMQSVSLQQTSGMVRNIRSKIVGGWAHNPELLHNVWALTEGENAKIKSPVAVNSKIWSVDAGFDMQADENNVLGMFASYRKGDYDFEGSKGRYHSTVGSDVDVDSWLAGLYYRYDHNNNWLFATVYGGKQDVESKTDDGVAKFNTDGIELGASVEAGHNFAIYNKLMLEPSLGVYYNQISLDDTSDNVGKEYKWKDLRHVEVEAGAKLEQQFDKGSVYVKPGLVQTFTTGDELKVTGLEKVSTYKDGLLTRIEIGGRYNLSDKLSGYAWGSYTRGSDYEATSGGLGISYAW